ncbi:MAG: hypothetical protein HY609_00700 [Deltaproteobacteria bacterium]|nr:hypothetical protein [Deltaproteobacteria bacterium]
MNIKKLTQVCCALIAGVFFFSAASAEGASKGNTKNLKKRVSTMSQSKPKEAGSNQERSRSTSSQTFEGQKSGGSIGGGSGESPGQNNPPAGADQPDSNSQ